MCLWPEIWILNQPVAYSITVNLSAKGIQSSAAKPTTHTYTQCILMHGCPQTPKCIYRLLAVTLHSYEPVKIQSVDREARSSGFLWHLLSDTTRAWQIHWCLNRPLALQALCCQIGVNKRMGLQGTGSDQAHSSASGCRVVHVSFLAPVLWCLDINWHMAVFGSYLPVCYINKQQRISSHHIN